MVLMRMGLSNKSYKYQMLAKAFLGLMLVYLLFYLFLSERSLPSLVFLSHQEQVLSQKLSNLKSERKNVYDRVVRLRPETLDPDLVEEYSIDMLGHRGGNTIIMLGDPRT